VDRHGEKRRGYFCLASKYCFIRKRFCMEKFLYYLVRIWKILLGKIKIIIIIKRYKVVAVSWW
jgi:hypothetical protein